MKVNPEIKKDEIKNLPLENQLQYKLALLFVIGGTFAFFFKILFL